MGHLSDPPIAAFALKLRDRLGLKRVIETGTYQGQSTQWAALNFEEVDTLDIDEGFVHHAIMRCDGLENIRFRIGDSRQVLPSVVKRLNEPALFWLDAHNANGIFGGGPDDCPILEELHTILCSPHRHAILIDDACCFIPPQPHDPKAYPEIGKLKAMAREAGRLCDIAHDVIAIIPPDLEAELGDFTRANYAVMHGFVPGGRRRFAMNLMRRQPFSVRATVAVGHATPEIQERPTPPPENIISEVVPTRYGTMILPTCDTNQTPSLRSAGIAQQWYEIDYLASLLEKKPGAVFLDVGANVGTFSFALRPHCSAVYAYEPQRLIFNMLAGSVALNGWTNVYCIHAAVGDHHGTVEVPQFDYTKPCSFGSIEFGSDKQREPLSQERGTDPDKAEYVSLVPLDMWNHRRVDLIKIDVEGMEFPVLDGAAKTIGLHKPVILIEHGKVSKVLLHQKLRGLGYEVRDLGADFLATPEGRV
jgi:FkbM family methyltransferase